MTEASNSTNGEETLVELFNHFTELRRAYRAERKREQQQDARMLALQRGDRPLALTAKGETLLAIELGRGIDDKRRELKRKAIPDNFESCLTENGSIKSGCVPRLMQYINADRTPLERLKVLEALELTASSEPRRLERFLELNGLQVLSQWLTDGQSTISSNAQDPVAGAVCQSILQLVKLLQLPVGLVRSSGLLAVCCEACFLPNKESSGLATSLVNSWSAVEAKASKTANSGTAVVDISDDTQSQVVGKELLQKRPPKARKKSPAWGAGYFPDPSLFNSDLQRSSDKECVDLDQDAEVAPLSHEDNEESDASDESPDVISDDQEDDAAFLE